MSRSYLAALAVAAALVLAVGIFVRQRLLPHEAAVAPPSQAAALQQLSRGAILGRQASFVADRAAAAGAWVAWVSDARAAGVRWSADTLVTTAYDAPVRLAARDSTPPLGDALRPVRDTLGAGPLAPFLAPVLALPDSAAASWLLVVGRDATDRVLSAALLAGGLTSAGCGGGVVERWVLPAPLDASLAGAGIFGLDGELLGMVTRCDGALLALPLSAVRALLATSAAPPAPADTGATVPR